MVSSSEGSFGEWPNQHSISSSRVNKTISINLPTLSGIPRHDQKPWKLVGSAQNGQESHQCFKPLARGGSHSLNQPTGLCQRQKRNATPTQFNHGAAKSRCSQVTVPIHPKCDNTRKAFEQSVTDDRKTNLGHNPFFQLLASRAKQPVFATVPFQGFDRWLPIPAIAATLLPRTNEPIRDPFAMFSTAPSHPPCPR